LNIVQALLQHPDVQVDACDKDGSTPLDCANDKGRLNIIQALLQHPDIHVNIYNVDR
jgi:ankyrin repeat protein